jgi:prolyl 4-hydroxylase
MLVYLKAPESGGETDFPALKKSVTPEQGTAVFFWVSNPQTLQLYKQTLHAGMDVKRGVKMIATQWIRNSE